MKWNYSVMWEFSFYFIGELSIWIFIKIGPDNIFPSTVNGIVVGNGENRPEAKYGQS